MFFSHFFFLLPSLLFANHPTLLVFRVSHMSGSRGTTVSPNCWGCLTFFFLSSSFLTLGTIDHFLVSRVLCFGLLRCSSRVWKLYISFQAVAHYSRQRLELYQSFSTLYSGRPSLRISAPSRFNQVVVPSITALFVFLWCCDGFPRVSSWVMSSYASLIPSLVRPFVADSCHCGRLLINFRSVETGRDRGRGNTTEPQVLVIFNILTFRKLDNISLMRRF